MRKRLLVVILCASMLSLHQFLRRYLDYEGTINAYKEDKKITADSLRLMMESGKKVKAVAKSDKVSVSAKATYIRSMPGKNGTEACKSVSWYEGRESCRM